MKKSILVHMPRDGTSKLWGGWGGGSRARTSKGMFWVGKWP